ncbi:hypothetical protein ASZ90_003393 [hydrocarbon metagenome]|uniref:Uncharacterized protein n=1 Tax=hydrocarbon metagenome TaxID=938273 RepID=A0A0W8G130_9ZZZZ
MDRDVGGRSQNSEEKQSWNVIEKKMRVRLGLRLRVRKG